VSSAGISEWLKRTQRETD